jgi:hypothetical protein
MAPASGGGAASARISAKCGGELSHLWSCELEWVLESSSEVWDGYESKQRRKSPVAAAMTDDGGAAST